MAKIVITIEDDLDGKVKMKADPSFEKIVRMANSGAQMTSAHGMAIFIINRVLDQKRKQQQQSRIIL